MPSTVKRRDPVKSALLDVVTLGIYGFYWFYVTNRDLAELGRARGTTELGENPTNSLLAAFPGVLILVPFVISGLNTAERVGAAQRLTGVGEDVSKAAAVIAMVLFFPIAIYYLQKRLNPVWDAAG
jgi:predicted small secreted protein